MIVESIVTTIAEDGVVNCAPMGVEWSDDAITLKPFLETATYRNVFRARAAVVNLTDDIRIFARGAISNPQPPTVPNNWFPRSRRATDRGARPRGRR